jgi:hypothetical protein
MSHEIDEQGEETMSPTIDQQVNLQELQRLNDAITMTFEAIRRVAPQLQLLQQQALWATQPQLGYGIGQGGVPHWAQQASQLGVQPFGMPHQMPIFGQAFGQPYGQSFGQTFGQSPVVGQPSPFGIFGQQPVVGQPYYGMPFNGYPQSYQPRF